MKKALTFGVVAVALATTLSLVAARSRQPEPEPDPVAGADLLASADILTTVREMGLNPIGQPIRRGPYYVFHAYDPRGIEVRVVADAQLGDILAIAPVRPQVPQYERGPRIIHVPQPGDRDQGALPDDRDGVATGSDDDDAAEPAPPPRPRAAPRPRQRSDGPPPAPRRKLHSTTSPLPPPPPVQRRAVLSAPPPSADTGLTPIYPTPKFKAATESADKFAPPKEPEITVSAPPPAAAIEPPPPPADSAQATPEQSTPPGEAR